MTLYYLTLLPYILLFTVTGGKQGGIALQEVKHSQSIHHFALARISHVPSFQKTTIRGKVHHQGKGIPDAVVSDGILVTKTDTNGNYQLPSDKQNGYVFISVPRNYEVPVVRTVPQFFQILSKDANELETKDFELFPSTSDKHVIAFLADMHLANRNDDLQQFKKGFLNDIKQLAAQYKAAGTKFYALTLGDQSWDVYWYKNSFGLPEYLRQMESLDFPVFNTIGNHDNDPYIANDWLSEAAYRHTLGPTYYSFNIGEVHYVVLDNVVFKNSGGAPGTIGDRSYEAEITDRQIAWLEQDLAMLADTKTPIVLAMHIPLHSNPRLGNSNIVLKNAGRLQNTLQRFSNIKIFTGHTHINYRIADVHSALDEYNIGAVSATWWWTGRKHGGGNHVCKDGSPGGYAVMETDRSRQAIYYKSIGYGKDYQFRAYDLNTVHITANRFAPKADSVHQAMVKDYAAEYTSPNKSNQILLNIWGYRPGWKIKVKENGKVLPVKHVHQKDPLHVISYTMVRLNANATPTPAFLSVNTSHLFVAQATKANTTLDISVTDDNGHEFKETMVRPKPFHHQMH
jgi:3',5'-cyclic AMP phosphodiesterase CpdA